MLQAFVISPFLYPDLSSEVFLVWGLFGLEQSGSQPSIMLRLFNKIPHVVVTPNH